MSREPADHALLEYIGEHEDLSKTLARFPGVTRAHLARLLRDAARTLPRGEAAPAARQASLPLATPPHPPRHPHVGGLARARVYCDGASRGNPGLAGAGAAIVDPATGKVVEVLKRFLGRQTNNVAEYEGLLLGLRRARDLGAREVEVVADSQLVIRQLGGEYRVKHPGLRPLYEDAMRLLKSFERVRLVHVPREQNALADEMSNRAIDER